MFSRFAGKYLSSNNFATVNIDDHIEVKMLASDPGRQIADVPTPDLIRCNGPEYIRPVYTGIHGIVSSTAWLISVHDKNFIQKQYKYLCLPELVRSHLEARMQTLESCTTPVFAIFPLLTAYFGESCLQYRIFGPW